jgi:hypothetical protein
MKITTLALVLAAFAFAPITHAEDAKPASTPAGCCKKAAASDKACTHGCCAAAAKESKNCEKCGGKNAPKTEAAS